MDGMVDESLVQNHVDETLYNSFVTPTTSKDSAFKTKRHKNTSNPVSPVSSYSNIQNTVTDQSMDSPVKSIESFNPNLMSTPISAKENIPLEHSQTTTVLVPNSQNQMELMQLPAQNLNLLNTAYYNNGFLQLPQYQPIILQVSTLDLLQNKLNLSASFGQQLQIPLKSVSNLTDDCKNSISHKEIKLRKFQCLNQEQPPQDVVSFLINNND